MVATVRHPTPWVPGPTLAVVLVLGCGSEPSAHAPDATGTTEATSTTSNGNTTEESTSGSSSPEDTADSTTGEPGPREYEGMWTPRAFDGVFIPCDEDQTYYVDGAEIPFELCYGSFYTRMIAVERPPEPGTARPRLEIQSLVLGPCKHGSCELGDPPGGCDWSELCTIDTGCDPLVQDCPEGDKCMPWANDGGGQWNATRCSPIANTAGQPGDPCTVEGTYPSGIDDCDIGAMCWNADPLTSGGTCVEMCTGDWTNLLCTTPGTGCAVAYDGVITLCLPPCEPFFYDCPEGHGCYPTQEGFFCLPDAPRG